MAMDIAEHLVHEHVFHVSLHDTVRECRFSNEVCSLSNSSEATSLANPTSPTNPSVVLLKIGHHFTSLHTQDFKTISIPTPLEFLQHTDSTILSGHVLELLISADLKFQQQDLSVLIMVPQNLPEAHRQSLRQACLEIGLHVTSIMNFSSALITRAEEEMEENGTDMDDADLPHDDDGDLLHRLQVEEGERSSHDEEEKAVSDLSVLPSPSKPLFSKVFGLATSSAGTDDDVSIPANYKPSKGSPSSYLQSNPSALRDSIIATTRLMVHSVDGGKDKIHYSTGFAVSPNLLMTTRHSLNKPEIVEIRACRGRTVFPHNFMEKKAWIGKLKSLPRVGSSTKKDKNGLFLYGADVGIVEVITPAEFRTFLLPCSPMFLSSAQRKKVAILSFPAIDGYLKEAKSELIKGKNVSQSVWKQYVPVMQRIYEKEIGELAKEEKMTVKKLKTMKHLTDQIDKTVRQRLYDELVNTFGFTHTGTMVCSVGSITCSNNASLGTTCSTLRGSSGAPICPMDKPGDFVGIHHGGSYGFDLNSATSCDNDSFVEYYVQEVLPTLPHPTDQCWSSRDMTGFVHWLRLHVTKIDKSSPWHGVTRRGLKRKP